MRSRLNFFPVSVARRMPALSSGRCEESDAGYAGLGGLLCSSAARRSVLTLHHRDEEAVGAVAQGAHEERVLTAVGGGKRRRAQIPLPELAPWQELEFRVAFEERCDLVAVLLWQHRAVDVSEASAGFDKRSALAEHRPLLGDPRLKHLGGQPPLSIRPPPPHP